MDQIVNGLADKIGAFVFGREITARINRLAASGCEVPQLRQGRRFPDLSQNRVLRDRIQLGGIAVIGSELHCRTYRQVRISRQVTAFDGYMLDVLVVPGCEPVSSGIERKPVFGVAGDSLEL